MGLLYFQNQAEIAESIALFPYLKKAKNKGLGNIWDASVLPEAEAEGHSSCPMSAWKRRRRIPFVFCWCKLNE